jgi:hypothetical protein
VQIRADAVYYNPDIVPNRMVWCDTIASVDAPRFDGYQPGLRVTGIEAYHEVRSLRTIATEKPT